MKGGRESWRVGEGSRLGVRRGEEGRVHACYNVVLTFRYPMKVVS